MELVAIAGQSRTAWKAAGDIQEKDILEKCKRFLIADRHILLRLWTLEADFEMFVSAFRPAPTAMAQKQNLRKESRGSKLAEERLKEELCKQRLRCPLDEFADANSAVFAEAKPPADATGSLASAGRTATAGTTRSSSHPRQKYHSPVATAWLRPLQAVFASCAEQDSLRRAAVIASGSGRLLGRGRGLSPAQHTMGPDGTAMIPRLRA